jgi:hypothetical protein
MWTIFEERDAAKVIDKLPHQVAEKYAFWFLCALDGATPTERIVEAMSALGTPGERDTVLALEALHRMGHVELVG